jgi:hypothetical protein
MPNTLLFGKINPVLSLPQQSNQFSQNITFLTADYMAAVADPYPLGATQVNFSVMYGNCEFNDSNEIIGFNTISRSSVNLSGSVIESWGVDDKVVLNAIAAAQGTAIVSTQIGTIDSFY